MSELSIDEKLAKIIPPEPKPTQILTHAEIRHILTEDPMEKSYKPNWPSVRDKEAILEAALQKKRIIRLGDVMFKLRYTEGRSYPNEGIDGAKVHSTVFVSPVRGFIPCGWFSIDQMKRDLDGE